MRSSGRKIFPPARSLGVSQAHIWKLTRQFKHGKLNVGSGVTAKKGYGPD
jgi:hypothetical protein